MAAAPTTRRRLLAASALVTAGALLEAPAGARDVAGALPWAPNEAYPPAAVRPGPWVFFTPEEAGAVEAIVDRLIPADNLSPGGRDAGVAVFIDRQLAGPYGSAEWWYMQGPFPPNPLPTQGFQSSDTPGMQYRKGLAALAAYTRATFGGRLFQQLSPEEQDRLLTAMERGEVRFEGADAKGLFEAILNNAQEGFFADPIYGGNRDMCGWKLLGFPGTRYDYREMLDRPNTVYPLPPVSLQGRPEWRPGGQSAMPAERRA